MKAAPFLKFFTGNLILVAPLAPAATKVLLDEPSYKEFQRQLDLSQKSFELVLKGGEEAEVGWATGEL